MKRKFLTITMIFLALSLYAQETQGACSQDYDDGYAAGYAEGFAAGFKAGYESVKKPKTKKTEAPKRKKVILPDDPNASYMVNLFNGKLLDKNNKEVAKKDFDKEFYIIFYGGDWCPYCKKEAPYLRDWYKEQKSKYKNFEIILAGTARDKSNTDLYKFMINEQFDFYFIDFNYQQECKFFEFETYTKAEKFYVPAYVLMDKDGKVITCSNLKTKDKYDVHRPLEEYLKIMQKREKK